MKNIIELNSDEICNIAGGFGGFMVLGGVLGGFLQSGISTAFCWEYCNYKRSGNVNIGELSGNIATAFGSADSCRVVVAGAILGMVIGLACDLLSRVSNKDEHQITSSKRHRRVRYYEYY